MSANKVIAIYRPKKGKEAALLKLVRSHHPRLVTLGYATKDAATILRSPKDGTLIEIFSWKSDAHVERAHRDPAIMEIWEAFAALCDYGTLGGLAEAGDMFPHFSELSGAPRGTKSGQRKRAPAKRPDAAKKPKKSAR
ncbi:MAG TPA: hypothetical protein PL096_06660 [Micropepsaceae bacterium]|nr:hypothetical protein [Micropepsaceae bacterium]